MFHNGAEIFEDTFLNQIQFNFKMLNNFTRSSINFAFPKKFREIIDAQRCKLRFYRKFGPIVCIATVAMLVQIDTSFGDPWNVKRTLNSVCEL